MPVDCYIVCNMFPPLVSQVVRAPGLRAEQLAHQAALNFKTVRYLMTKSRYDMLTNNAALCQGIRAHPDFIVVHDNYLQLFLDRIDRSAFVFSQVEMPAVFDRAIKRHYVVYDMLASKSLELRSGNSSPEEIEVAERRHQRFAARADRILINGAKLRTLNADLLAARDDDDIRNNPFCPVSPPPHTRPKSARNCITFFSAAQRWTNNSNFLGAMADVLCRRANLDAYFMTSQKSHEDPESIAISRLQQMPNVRRINALSYPAHLALLARSLAVLDWSVVNDERRYSTSTRLIQAVSSGVAVFGNAETGLDTYWDGYPGATSETEPDADMLEAFIDRAVSGGYENDLRRADAWSRAVLADRRVFGGIQ